MLAAEALRLAAIEVLAPTASLASGVGFPTLAGHRVYDSAFMAHDDLDDGEAWTPCLSLFTDDVRIERRGEGAPSVSGAPSAVLEVIAELAVRSTDDDGQPVAVPLGSNDAKTQLVLGALCAQVRKALVFAPAGAAFRQIGFVVDTRIEPFSLPQFDFRWMRTTMRFTCTVKDDKFGDEAGLPEPIRSFAQALPVGSYAKGKLAELATYFAATSRDELRSIALSADRDPADAPEWPIS